MKRNVFVIYVSFVLVFFLPHVACSKPKGNKGEASVQMPAVAGQFYTADKSELAKQVKTFLSEAPAKSFDGNLVGLIAPHAGYRYSGAVAASAFKQLEGKTFERVVVMAPSHHVPFMGVSFSTKDFYRTPLGNIPIDTNSIKELVGKYKWAVDDPRPYEVEHSLEVELPFLQEALGSFKLVPLIIGENDLTGLNEIARGLNDFFVDGKTLFVASSDLSHYLPYDSAVSADKKTISAICDDGPSDYYKAVAKGNASLCGSSPVYIMKEIAKLRGASLKLIEYANSGDTAGDRSRVVGYASIAVVQPDSFGEKQKGELLKLARATLEASVTGKKLPKLPDDPELKKDGAAFVTLKKGGHLRGCIGHIIASGPLDKCVQNMTVAASSEDPRFPRVKLDELKDIDIEISVLTKPERLSDPLAVRVGTDGLMIKKGFHRGVLLPQVPTEQGWDKMEYLEGICRKAGLPKDAWKDAELERFQAIVFGE